jgi:hypothetical protein
MRLRALCTLLHIEPGPMPSGRYAAAGSRASNVGQICPNVCPFRDFFLDWGKRIDDSVRTQEYRSFHAPYLTGGLGVLTTSPILRIGLRRCSRVYQLSNRNGLLPWLHSAGVWPGFKQESGPVT